MPIGERDEFVEVWMQYQITVYEPDGETVIAVARVAATANPSC